MKHPLLIIIIFINILFFLVLSCELPSPSASASMVIRSATYNSSRNRAVSDFNKTCSVDGLRLWIKDIMVELPDETAEREDIWRSAGSGGEMIDLRSSDDVQKITSQISLPLKLIRQIRITFMDHFSIKTYVNHTDGKYYYTTTSGVKSGAGTFNAVQPPLDYDFLHYSFVHPTTGIPGDETIYQTQYAFYPQGIQIEEEKEYIFEIYVDLVNLVNFWDGTPGERGSPFSWAYVEEGYTPEQYYPDNVPAFGCEYIPFCFVIYEKGQTAAPVMETYVSSYYRSDLDTLYASSSIELTTISYVFLNANDACPIYGSARGEGLGGDGIYANFRANPAGGFDFSNYSWNGAYENDYADGFIIATAAGFPRLDVGGMATFNYSYQTQPPEKYVLRIR